MEFVPEKISVLHRGHRGAERAAGRGSGKAARPARSRDVGEAESARIFHRFVDQGVGIKIEDREPGGLDRRKVLQHLLIEICRKGAGRRGGSRTKSRNLWSCAEVRHLE